jgi:hypothetical protein
VIQFRCRHSSLSSNAQKHSNQIDSCLTPTTDSDLPLLIEEYHQLFRIIMLHELEDAREMVKKNVD